MQPRLHNDAAVCSSNWQGPIYMVVCACEQYSWWCVLVNNINDGVCLWTIFLVMCACEQYSWWCVRVNRRDMSGGAEDAGPTVDQSCFTCILPCFGLLPVWPVLYREMHRTTWQLQVTTKKSIWHLCRGEREFPFRSIPKNESLWFPFPNYGNWFFHSLPVPELWEWIFFIPFLLPNLPFHRWECSRKLKYCERHQTSNIFSFLYISYNNLYWVGKLSQGK